MEDHSTNEWWEADNQSDVAPEVRSSQASTLSSANNAIQYLITENRSQQCHTDIKKETSNQLMKAVGTDLVIHCWNYNKEICICIATMEHPLRQSLCS